MFTNGHFWQALGIKNSKNLISTIGTQHRRKTFFPVRGTPWRVYPFYPVLTKWLYNHPLLLPKLVHWQPHVTTKFWGLQHTYHIISYHSFPDPYITLCHTPTPTRHPQNTHKKSNTSAHSWQLGRKCSDILCVCVQRNPSANSLPKAFQKSSVLS